MIASARGAWSRLRGRRGRSLLAAAGIAAVAAMMGTATTVAYGLATGFDRAAERADLPDLIARFEPEQVDEVDARVEALPNVASRSYRQEATEVPLASAGQATSSGAVHVVGDGRRGYAIVAGDDLSGAGDEVVVERGLADAWGLAPGDRLSVAGVDARIVGVAVAPDNVAFPLASAPRVYVASQGLGAQLGADPGLTNMALIWSQDPSRLDTTLVQARAVSFGIDNLRFLTRAGVQVQLDEAAGIVIALLIAFSAAALGVAGVTLGATARAEVQRRLETIGVMRGLGFSRIGVAAQYGLEAVIVAVPAGALGLGVGALLAYGPSARLLESLNELPPGAALLAPLAGCLLVIVGLVALATMWPAWRAASRRPAEILRGAELTARPRRLPYPAGFFGLGARLVAARVGRTAATVSVLAVSTALVLLMLALATRLDALQNDPASLGKRYQLTVNGAPDSTLPVVRDVPGVAAAAPRYEASAADSFQLGETFKLIAFPGDHTEYESPPVTEGRRVQTAGEAEIGAGLANALGARRGSTIAAQLGSGREVRFRVVGIVAALGNEGRVAYVRPTRLLEGDPGLTPAIAVRLSPGADPAQVTSELRSRGIDTAAVGAATSSSREFLGVLADVLRVVAIVNILIALFILTQSLALTALERRPTLAVLRAGGAGRREVALVLAGGATLVVALAAPAGVVLERAVLGPAVADMAVDYVTLPLSADVGQITFAVLGLLLLALTAALWVARQVGRTPIAVALREE